MLPRHRRPRDRRRGALPLLRVKRVARAPGRERADAAVAAGAVARARGQASKRRRRREGDARLEGRSIRANVGVELKGVSWSYEAPRAGIESEG
jgi:hypothetical protein